MCWEDIKIGRGQDTVSKRVAVAAAAAVTVAGSANERNRLILAWAGAAPLFVKFGEAASATNFDAVISTANPTHYFRVEDWGETLRHALSVFDALAGGSLGVTEVSIREKQWKT